MLKNFDETLQLAGNKIKEIQNIFSFDIFHGYYIYSAYLAVFWAKFFNIKSVISLRGNDIDRGIFSRNFQFILWSLNNADAVYCVSRELIKKCKIITKRKNIYFIPNSVNSNLFKPEEKNKELLEKFRIKDEKIIGFVGELRFKKGTSYILEAFKQVNRKIPSRLFLVGGIRRDDREIFKNFIFENKDLKDKIHIVDYIDNPQKLSEYYNLMDVLVFPSLWDGMPNSILEAMSCGKLVIGSNAGGIKDIIIHNKNGFLIDTSELNRLAEGILEIFEMDEKTVNKIKRNAREYVIKNFSEEIETEKIINIYKKLDV